MNLHDWIDELCDVLDLDAEVDESLLADLARSATENVGRSAGPVTAYLLGVAAGQAGAGPEQVEAMAARAQELADRWDQPASARPIRDDDGDDDADVAVDDEDVFA